MNFDDRRVNPIVDRYVTTDLPLLAILQNTPELRSPMVQALLHIQECLAGRRLARDAMSTAQAAPLKGADPELLALMLSSWAELSCRIGRPSEAQVLLHRARALISENTHPEIRASVLLVESLLADTTGNKARSEQIMKEILQFLAPYSARRKFYVWEIALFLCQQGRGVECQAELRELPWQCNDQFRILRVLLLQFVDAVETGRVQEAFPIVSQIASGSPEQMKELSRIPYRAYHALLRLMQERGPEDTAALFEQTQLTEPPNWVKVVRCLLIKNTEEALRLARLEANKLLNSIFGGGFDSFNLIRAELASGHSEGAIRVLKMRQERGNRHYLDNFFSARAELLAGNKHAASRHFAEALKSVEFYRAKGRLDFELKLACELSQGDIVQLTRSADKITLRETAARKPAPSEPAQAKPAAPQREIDRIIGDSQAISELRTAITRYASLDAPVLITGETGTGKELVAKALHNLSNRKEHPFIAVNCGSITETLLESELFGHEKGAFTGAERANRGLFEEAGSGTILLDEIGDVSLRLQGSLLRVLETGEIRAVGSAKSRKINCRILAATNAEISSLAEKGLFRKDLVYRLQRLVIHLPPLRERDADVLLLTRYFMDVGRPIGVHATVSSELRQAIRSYDWPGNVRELRNVIERMRLMHSDKLLYGLDDLDIKFHATGVTQARQPRSVPSAVRQDATEEGPSPHKTPAREPEQHPAAADLEKAESIQDSDVEQYLQESNSKIRRLDRLQGLFRKHRKLTRNEVMEILNVSPNTATKDLKELCDSSFIKRVEPSSSTRSHYFVLNEQPESSS